MSLAMIQFIYFVFTKILSMHVLPTWSWHKIVIIIIYASSSYFLFYIPCFKLSSHFIPRSKLITPNPLRKKKKIELNFFLGISSKPYSSII